MTLLDKIDNAVFRPAAHPTMFALVIGVAIGTVFIPEIWCVVREHMFPRSPRPNMDLNEAVKHLILRSQWAIGRPYYNRGSDRLIVEDINGIIRDAAAQKQITIWGRPNETGAGSIFGPATEIEVPATVWPNMSLDLTTMEGTAPKGVCARAHAQDQYCWLRVDRREFYREWPSASVVRLWFDKTWKSRKEQDCQ